MASSSDRSQEHCCFSEWMVQQERDLSPSWQRKAQQTEAPVTDREPVRHLQFHFIWNNNAIQVFNELGLFENWNANSEYSEQRIRLAREDVSPFFSPTWCSSRSSLLWLGGCRPTMFIRLIYALSGLQLESQLAQFLEGIGTINFNRLFINDLHKRTIKEEERFLSWKASLQEQIGDQKTAEIVSRCKPGKKSEPNRKVDEALDDYEESLVSVSDADGKLRLEKVKELMNALSPVQSENFLVASKKLHICV